MTTNTKRGAWAENPKTETLVVRVEPALKRDIERLAKKAGRPMATVARMLLREAVDLRKGNKP